MRWRDELRPHRRWRLEDVRGDQLLGNDIEREALGSEKRLVASLTATPRSSVSSGARTVCPLTDYNVVC